MSPSLRQAIESHDRNIIIHSLRRGWSAPSPLAASPNDCAWHPTLWDALGATPTDAEKDALARSLIAMPVTPVCPAGWPAGDNYKSPPDEDRDYWIIWEWWSPAERERQKGRPGCVTTPEGWFRGRIDW